MRAAGCDRKARPSRHLTGAPAARHSVSRAGQGSPGDEAGVGGRVRRKPAPPPDQGPGRCGRPGRRLPGRIRRISGAPPTRRPGNQPGRAGRTWRAEPAPSGRRRWNRPAPPRQEQRRRPGSGPVPPGSCGRTSCRQGAARGPGQCGAEPDRHARGEDSARSFRLLSGLVVRLLCGRSRFRAV